MEKYNIILIFKCHVVLFHKYFIVSGLLLKVDFFGINVLLTSHNKINSLTMI